MWIISGGSVGKNSNMTLSSHDMWQTTPLVIVLACERRSLGFFSAGVDDNSSFGEMTKGNTHKVEQPASAEAHVSETVAAWKTTGLQREERILIALSVP